MMPTDDELDSLLEEFWEMAQREDNREMLLQLTLFHVNHRTNLMINKTLIKYARETLILTGLGFLVALFALTHR